MDDFIEAGGRDERLRKPLSENELARVTGNLMRERDNKGVFMQGGSYGWSKNTGR